MTIDNEEDRGLLLQLIQSATVPGGAVLVVADLIQRIKQAKVSSPINRPSDEQSASGSY